MENFSSPCDTRDDHPHHTGSVQGAKNLSEYRAMIEESPILGFKTYYITALKLCKIILDTAQTCNNSWLLITMKTLALIFVVTHQLVYTIICIPHSSVIDNGSL